MTLSVEAYGRNKFIKKVPSDIMLRGPSDLQMSL